MNDAHAQTTHEPKDPASDRFPESHVAMAPDNDTSPWAHIDDVLQHSQLVAAIEKRISALETNVGILLESTKPDEKRIEIMAGTTFELMKQHMDMKVALAKQRAVNEALLGHFGRDEIFYDPKIAAALREALK